MLNERKLTADELAAREKIIQGMKKNKSKLVKKYGADAEKFMYGRATNIAKQQAETLKQSNDMKDDKLRKMIQDVLSKPLDEEKKSPKYLGGKEFPSFKNPLEGLPTEYKELLKKLQRSNDPAERTKLTDKMNVIRKELNLRPLTNSNESLDEKKKPFPDLTGDGKVTKADILKARGVELEEDLDLGHKDNEPHMIKAELAQIGKYAMELYKMVDQFEGPQEVDFPAWWQGKITTAKDMVSSAKHYLEFELEEPKIDAMVNVASQEGAIDEEMTPQKSKKIGMSFEGMDEAMVATLTEKIMKRLKNKI
jgi:hypothetical protein